MNVQKIVTPAGERLVLLPEEDFEALIAATEDAADAAALDEATRKLRAGEEELVPVALLDRMLDGVNRTRVWREHRGLSEAELVARAGIAPIALAEIESGQSPGSVETLRKIATALGVTIDDLVE